MTPQVRVVRGAPDETELAALVAGIAARSAGRAPEHPGRERRRRDESARRRWREAARPAAGAAGLPCEPGDDAWRWSAR